MRRLVFDQSSPVHPVSEYRGGSTSVTNGGGGQTEILGFNIGCMPFPYTVIGPYLKKNELISFETLNC